MNILGITSYHESSSAAIVCDGKLVASLPLAPAVKSDEVTVLPRAAIDGEGVQDLCFRFSQRKLDPVWVIDWIVFGAPS